MNSYVSMEHYLVVSSLLFAIGMVGMLLHKRNIINLLMSIELMLLSVNINFVTFSAYLHEMSGQIFSIAILAVAAAETAVGLAILILYFKNKGSIRIEDPSQMQG